MHFGTSVFHIKPVLDVYFILLLLLIICFKSRCTFCTGIHAGLHHLVVVVRTAPVVLLLLLNLAASISSTIVLVH